MFILNPKDSSPIFVQLKKQIIEFIVLGIYLPDDHLPSVRSLANELGINPNTVSRAYSELEIEGYIYSIAKKGCFVSKNNLTDRIKCEKLELLKECIKECKKYGMTKYELIDCIEMIYGKE